MKPDMRGILNKAGLFLLGIAASLILAEIGSRIVLPIQTRTCLTLDGKPVRVIADDHHFVSNLVFRQVSEEYDALTHITAEGHRAPATDGKPDWVFIGDSFCFGTGVTDEDTFVNQFAGISGLRCVNLGFIPPGTIRVIDILEHYLIEHRWRPANVMLVMTVSTASLLAGNDFADNLVESRAKIRKDMARATGRKPSFMFYSTDWEARWKIEWMLRHCNLARIVRYYLDPIARIHFSGTSDQDRMNKALDLTGAQLVRFAEMGKEYGFDCTILICHPNYDMSSGNAGKTAAVVRRLAGGMPVIDTAEAVADLGTCYFKHDGHFTPEGHRRVAKALADSIIQKPEGDKSK